MTMVERISVELNKRIQKDQNKGFMKFLGKVDIETKKRVLDTFDYEDEKLNAGGDDLSIAYPDKWGTRKDFVVTCNTTDMKPIHFGTLNEVSSWIVKTYC